MYKLIALLLFGVLVGWATEIIPFAEIRPGMTGYGLTVVQGTEISRFLVEVVDVLDEPGEMYDFIVVRAFGEAIVRSGGLAAGMSGSPVYLEGKLAGALSRAFVWARDWERPLGLVTPIETMLKLLPELDKPEILKLEKTTEILVPPGGNLQAMGIERIILAQVAPEEIPEGAVVALPIVPVVVSNASPRALEVLRNGLDFSSSKSPFVKLIPSFRRKIPGLSALGITHIFPAPPRARYPTLAFQPGAPVGVALALGDFVLGAIGTVTLVQDEKILAFGHPAFFTGPCRYFLTGAAVLDTVASMYLPFKFGTITDLRGGVFVDRWAAIAGRTDRVPPFIATEISVTGEGTAKLSLQLADVPRLLPIFLFRSVMEAVDRALDRFGPGTVQVRYTITGRGLPRPLTRENIFFSMEDVAQEAGREVTEVFTALLNNEFCDPLFTAVKLEAKISPEILTARIVELATDRETYRPGDTIKFTLTLRHWRGETRTVEGSLQIPADVVSPQLELRAYGGPRPEEEDKPEPKNIEELLDHIEGVPTNDTFTVELVVVEPPPEVPAPPEGGVFYGGITREGPPPTPEEVLQAIQAKVEVGVRVVASFSGKIPGVVITGETSLTLTLEVEEQKQDQ